MHSEMTADNSSHSTCGNSTEMGEASQLLYSGGTGCAVRYEFFTSKPQTDHSAEWPCSLSSFPLSVMTPTFLRAWPKIDS